MLTDNILNSLHEICDEAQMTAFNELQELYPKAPNNDQKNLELFLKVLSPYLDINDGEHPYKPVFVDGANESTSFQINEFSKKDILALESLNFKKLPLLLTARISDMLWLLNRNYTMAENAFKDYLLLGEKHLFNPDQCFVGFEEIKRAMHIAQQLGKKNSIHKQWFMDTEKMLVKVSVGNENWIPNELIQLLLMPNFRDYRGERNNKSYIEILERQIKCWESSFTNCPLLVNAFDTIRNIYKGAVEKISIYDLRLAETYEKYVDQAAFTNVYSSIEMLNSARLLYTKHKIAHKIREISEKIKPLQLKIVEQMERRIIQVDIFPLVKEFPSLLGSLRKAEKLDFLAEATRFFQKNMVIERLKTQKKQSVFSDFLKKVIVNQQGEVVYQFPPLSDKKENIILHAHRSVVENELLLFASYLPSILSNLEEEGWNEEDFEFLFKNSWLIPDEVISTLKTGFSMGLNGKIDSAAPIFLSSIEPIVRNYVDVCGGITTLLRNNGITEQLTLGSLLKDEAFIEKCDENILFTLDAFFSSKAGVNAKNNFSHGRNDWQRNTVVNTYLLCLLLKLCYISSIEGTQRYDTFLRSPQYIKANEEWLKGSIAK